MGLRLLLDLDNVVDQQVFVSGTWEKGTIDTLLSLAREERQRHGGEAVFVDIGAHWGLYALPTRAACSTASSAFEPDPTNYGQLQANLFLNGAEHAIEALQLATSDRSAPSACRSRPSQSRRHHVVEVAQVNQVTCRAVRVDQQLDITGKLLVIKMDVEGHEMEAIDGLLGLLAKNRCILQVEIWSTPEEEMPRRLALLETLFARYGIKFARDHRRPLFCVGAARVTQRKHEQGSGRACASCKSRNDRARADSVEHEHAPLHPGDLVGYNGCINFVQGGNTSRRQCVCRRPPRCWSVSRQRSCRLPAPLRRSGCSSPARPSAAFSTWRKPSSRAGGRATTSRRCCSTRPPTRCSRRRSSLRARTPRSASSCRIPVSAGSRSPRATAPRP